MKIKDILEQKPKSLIETEGVIKGIQIPKDEPSFIYIINDGTGDLRCKDHPSYTNIDHFTCGVGDKIKLKGEYSEQKDLFLIMMFC